jgi:nitrite reductase/ring-hydroxylating ferredoxin subunit
MSLDVLHDVQHVMDNLSPDQTETLDRWSDQLQSVMHAAVEQGGPAARRLKNWLNGVWLGHPLHPALTDVALGAWTTGAILDLVNARGAADAAITVGVLSAVPTAMAGAADWSDTEGEARRTGLVHAMLNGAGLSLMVASLFARRANRRALGIGLSTTGLGLAGVSAWLGGHLVYALGSSVNRAAFEPPVDDFKVVMAESALEEHKLVGAQLDVEGTPVPLVLLRKGRTVMALSGTCTHWGGPLAEGKLVTGSTGDECVECPWHASVFRFADGSVDQGPATVAEPVYEARIAGDNVEVRRRAG